MVYQVPTPCFPKKDSGYGFNKKIRFQAHPDGTWYGLWTGLENPLWFEGNLGSEFIFTLCLSDIKKIIVGGRVICFMVFDTFHILMAIMIYAISGCPWVLVKATLADFFHQIRSNCSNSNLKWTLYKMTITAFTVSAKCSLFFSIVNNFLHQKELYVRFLSFPVSV